MLFCCNFFVNKFREVPKLPLFHSEEPISSGLQLQHASGELAHTQKDREVSDLPHGPQQREAASLRRLLASGHKVTIYPTNFPPTQKTASHSHHLCSSLAIQKGGTRAQRSHVSPCLGHELLSTASSAPLSEKGEGRGTVPNDKYDQRTAFSFFT